MEFRGPKALLNLHGCRRLGRDGRTPLVWKSCWKAYATSGWESRDISGGFRDSCANPESLVTRVPKLHSDRISVNRFRIGFSGLIEARGRTVQEKNCAQTALWR